MRTSQSWSVPTHPAATRLALISMKLSMSTWSAARPRLVLPELFVEAGSAPDLRRINTMFVYPWPAANVRAVFSPNPFLLMSN